MQKKRISILGATGSVGTSTLRVIQAFPDHFDIALLAAQRSRQLLLEQARRFEPEMIAIGSREDAAWLSERLAGLKIQVLWGEQGLLEAVAAAGAHLTVSAIVGAAGLQPTLAAISAGSHIGLANKESMVVAGYLVNRAAHEAGVQLLPIDSEHNALHQCLRGERREEVKRLILTASGGPFRTYAGALEEITPEQALKHPTWEMGPKISIDSATMMNKGLEVIEAHHLFDFPPDQIDIVVHPQSVVHSMIETVDQSYKCQLGKTDMCDPILYALNYPRRLPNPFSGLDITQGLHLDFFPVDRERFPCVQLAYDALQAGTAAPAVLNAANEVAVAAFLERQINFAQIPAVNARGLAHLGHRRAETLEQILDLDREARVFAREHITSKPTLFF